MLCKLRFLYADGILIEKDQLAETPAYAGNLIVEDWIEGGVFKRPVRSARLMSTDHSIATDIIAPLFEPVIIKMTTQQMTLQGYQISAKDGASVHYMQTWAIRMVESGQ